MSAAVPLEKGKLRFYGGSLCVRAYKEPLCEGNC